MGLRFLFCGFVVLAAAPAPAQGPAPAPETIEIGPSGEAYLKALRYRRIDSEVHYYDPTRPAPDLETDATPPTPETEAEATPAARIQTGLVATLFLALVLFLFLRYGGGLSVSFGREGEDARRAAGGPAPPGGHAANATLGAILAMADRRAALVSLASTALARAVDAQGLLFQQSWTGRDVLRHLPASAAQRDDLRALVLASERVHFGGYDVSEDEFRAHVARIRPLLEGGRA